MTAKGVMRTEGALIPSTSFLKSLKANSIIQTLVMLMRPPFSRLSSPPSLTLPNTRSNLLPTPVHPTQKSCTAWWPSW